MFIVALAIVLLAFLGLVTHPERWPEKCASFLRGHNINHG